MEDGLLITGQDPTGAEGVGGAVVKKLRTGLITPLKLGDEKAMGMLPIQYARAVKPR